MKKQHFLTLFMVLYCTLSLEAQQRSRPSAATPAPVATGDYATDVGVVLDAQGHALEQARQMMEGGGGTGDQVALTTAIKEMERSQAALTDAKKSPEKLSVAVAAEQSAYQALLKALPREYRVSRSRNSGQRGGGNSSGQPGEQELNQLELTGEENRYETERQAAATPTPQQTEQAQTVDRLKQLARRQQDLNERLRDLQTALQEARTDQEREEAQRQLKRLRDEERQMLSDVDEMRQQTEQSPNASQQTATRQQLDQTRNDVQRAAQEMERQSVSEALAAGSRAEENLQNLRENLRQQTSSQFSQQMRQLQNQARDLADKEDQIAQDLKALNEAEQKPLDDSAQRRPLVEQMARQQSALTNLVGQMRAVTEQAESTEPLLSKQLYDILRNEDQKHTDSQLEIGAQLVDRGFLPQATQMEQVARTNINELRQGVDAAAESVLGSEADALRYAQKELDALSGQLARELSAGTNSTASSGGTNSSGRGRQDSRAGNRGDRGDTNALAGAGGQAGDEQNGTENPRNGGRGRQAGAGNNRGEESQAQRSGGSAPGRGADANSGTDSEAQAGGEQDAAQNPRGGGQGRRGGAGDNQAEASQAQRSGGSGAGRGGASPEDQAGDGGRGDNAGREQLRQFAQQLGGGRGGLGLNGPITGNDYMDWSDRLRDVEQAVDSQDVRNQLATVRERVGAYRRDFRQNGRIPTKEELQKNALAPLTLARDWVAQELSRAQKDRSLVPLDRDPVQDKYSDAVRQYYETLGSLQ